MFFAPLLAVSAAAGFRDRHFTVTGAADSYTSPSFRMTEGEDCPGAVKNLWPLPKDVKFTSCDRVPIASARISAPDQLRKAVESYQRRLGSSTGSAVGALGLVEMSPTQRILDIKVEIGEQSSLLQNGTFVWAGALSPTMDESYHLRVDAPTVVLRAQTPVGALRGLETLSQLADHEGVPAGVEIRDAPRFPHRGVLLDSSRHFLPVDTVTSFLDTMAMNKLNVLHWHLTDAQGYALGDAVSKKYGLDKGALYSGATYSEDDLRAVVAHAAGLGIRVVPELDGPAHVQSWGAGQPGAVVECGYHTVMLPTGQPLVPKMLDELIGHLSEIFPDKNMHLGADEVSQESMRCMRQNPTVMKWVHEHQAKSDLVRGARDETAKSLLQQGGGWTAVEQVRASDQDLKDAVASYIGMVAHIAKKHGKQPIFWQEAFDDYGHNSYFSFNPPEQLPRDAIIQVWKGWSGTAKMPDVVGQGFQALKSNGWYLDLGEDDNWVNMYREDPARSVSSGQENVHGGEACLWGEHIDRNNLFSRAYPRLSGVAERLWSQEDVTHVGSATERLKSMRCRLTERGYPITDLHDHACEE